MPIEIILSLAGSLVAGSLIGLEREFRSRPAGLRTHTLVCLASALLMVAAARQGEWNIVFIPGETIVTDPTRMAHGVLTGIGFLCAGVIFREGFSVQGLTTASSLWLTSALGLLFGVGMHVQAVAGTAVTHGILIGFRMLYRFLPRQTSADVVVVGRGDAEMTGACLRTALASEGLSASQVSLRILDDMGQVEHRLKIVARQDLDLDQLAAKLMTLRGVVNLAILPHEDG